MKGREGEGKEFWLSGVGGLKGRITPPRSSGSGWGSRTLPGPRRGKNEVMMTR